MKINAKQLAVVGQIALKEAILDVLYRAHPGGYGIGGADISKGAGIYRKHGVAGLNDGIVTGFLNQLYEEKRVKKAKQANGRGGWKLTDIEYKRHK